MHHPGSLRRLLRQEREKELELRDGDRVGGERSESGEESRVNSLAEGRGEELEQLPEHADFCAAGLIEDRSLHGAGWGRGGGQRQGQRA